MVYCNVCLFWFVRLESENPCAAVSLLYCYICCTSLRKRASSQFVNDTVTVGYMRSTIDPQCTSLDMLVYRSLSWVGVAPKAAPTFRNSLFI